MLHSFLIQDRGKQKPGVAHEGQEIADNSNIGQAWLQVISKASSFQYCDLSYLSLSTRPEKRSREKA